MSGKRLRRVIELNRDKWLAGVTNFFERETYHFAPLSWYSVTCYLTCVWDWAQRSRALFQTLSFSAFSWLVASYCCLFSVVGQSLLVASRLVSFVFCLFWLFSPKSFCLFVFYFRQSSLFLCPLSSQSFDSPLFSLFFNPSLFLSSLSWSVFQSILSSAVFSFFSFGWPVYFGCLCLLPAVNVLFRATFRPLFSSSRPFLSLLLSLSFWFLFFNPLFGHLSSVFGPLWSAYCTFFSPLFAQFAVLSSNFVCSSLHLSFGQLSVLSTLFSFQYLFFLSSLSWLVTRWLPSLLTVLQSFLTSLSWFVPFFIYCSLVFKLSERTYLSGK